ncbi:unnamed protein product, partial [Closterium sp. NIES-53]
QLPSGEIDTTELNDYIVNDLPDGALLELPAEPAAKKLCGEGMPSDKPSTSFPSVPPSAPPPMARTSSSGIFVTAAPSSSRPEPPPRPQSAPASRPQPPVQEAVADLAPSGSYSLSATASYRNLRLHRPSVGAELRSLTCDTQSLVTIMFPEYSEEIRESILTRIAALLTGPAAFNGVVPQFDATVGDPLRLPCKAYFRHIYSWPSANDVRIFRGLFSQTMRLTNGRPIEVKTYTDPFPDFTAAKARGDTYMVVRNVPLGVSPKRLRENLITAQSDAEPLWLADILHIHRLKDPYDGSAYSQVLGLPVAAEDDPNFDRIPTVLWFSNQVDLGLLDISCHSCSVGSSNHRVADHAVFALTHRIQVPNKFTISVSNLQAVNGMSSFVALALFPALRFWSLQAAATSFKDPGLLLIGLDLDVEVRTCSMCEFECGLALDSALFHMGSDQHRARLQESAHLTAVKDKYGAWKADTLSADLYCLAKLMRSADGSSRRAAESRPSRAAQQLQPSRPAAAEPPSSSRAAQQQPSRPAAAEPPRSCRAAQEPPSRPATTELPNLHCPGRAVDFEVWVDDLQLFLQCDRADGLSLFDLTSGASPAPAADADPTVRSQWATRDAAARLAVRRHLPTTERAHFSQYNSAQTLYDAVVARYSSPATAALSRLALPFLFPNLAAFHTVADLITHLRTIDTRYRAALPADFCAKNPPPMYLTLYFLVTRLPDSLRVVRDHFLAVCPTTLTVDGLEKSLLAAEQSIVAVGASRGDPRTPIFEGCSPSPLLPSVASAAATDRPLPFLLWGVSTPTPPDSFYRGLTEEELKHASDFNFDHPDAFDTDALLSTIVALKEGQSVEIPVYDFKTHQRSTAVRKTNPADVIILEGILVFHEARVRRLMNMKVFVDTDADVRLARRIRRDTLERGRDVQGVIDQYARFVKPAFDDFVLPSKKFADIIIPRGGDNHVAVNLIVQHIGSKLGQHDLRKIYSNCGVVWWGVVGCGVGFNNHVAVNMIVQHIGSKLGQHDLRKIHSNVHVIESTFQMRGA